MMRFIKMYGLQRTHTNWMEWILAANFDVTVLVNEMGWKHGSINTNDPDWTQLATVPKLRGKVPALQAAYQQGELKWCFCVKNPFAWYRSFRAYRQGASLTEAMQMWNQRNAHYLQYFEAHKANCGFVRYEALLGSSHRVLSRLAKKLQLTRTTTKAFVLAQKIMNKGSQETRKPFDPSYYLQHRYLDDLTPDIIRIILKLVNRDLVSKFDYDAIYRLAQERV